MLVLDEQLLGRGIERAIHQWYHGKVVYVTELRPNTVIKDDVIPFLLQQQQQPTFITINERDFWQRIQMNARCCIICFSLSDAHADRIPALLRRLLHVPIFRAKSQRMGHVIRVAGDSVSYYQWNSTQVHTVEW